MTVTRFSGMMLEIILVWVSLEMKMIDNNVADVDEDDDKDNFD